MTPLYQTIRMLGKCIPVMECVPGCHDCCGPVLATIDEIRRLPAKTSKQREAALDELNCVYLDSCGCQIYQDRPLICRLFGTTEKLPCPRGVKPLKVVARSVEDKIFSVLAKHKLRLI